MSNMLPFLLGLMMFILGLSVTRQDTASIVSRPLIVLLGLACQLILLPLVGFMLASAAAISPELKIGIIAICACPGGILSNYIAYHAGGSLALSISLTLLSSLITVFSIPIIMNTAQVWLGLEQTTVVLPLLPTMLSIAKMTMLPVAAGLLIRYAQPNIANQMIKWMSPACSILLAVYILYFWYQQTDAIVSAAKSVGLIMLLLMLICCTIIYLICRILDITEQYRTTLIVETSIQNGALAFTVTAVLMKNMAYAVPTVFYTVAMFLPALVVIAIKRTRAKKLAQ